MHLERHMLSGMPPYAVKTVENGRLAWYGRAARPDFWDEYWATRSFGEVRLRAREGYLGPFEGVFTRYLPELGRILEAGCGPGHLVVALRTRGYDIEGVEWSQRTVEAAKRTWPDVPIRLGDVTSLDVPDGWYSGYISIGVVEHSRAGPGPFLREARRVLAPGGVALVAVPYFHPVRRLKALLACYRAQPNGLEFYQYAFTEDDIDAELREAGFHVLTHFRYDGFEKLREEMPTLRWLCALRGVGWRLRRILCRLAWLDRHLGHMTLAICS